MSRPCSLTVWFWLCTSSLLACSDASQNRQDPTDGGLPSSKIRITGNVLDAELFSAVPKAELTTLGGGQGTSKADGSFDLLAADTDLDVAVGRESFASTYRRLPKGGGSMQVYLKSIDQKMQFRGDAGLTVSLPSGVRLEIPKDAVLDAEGKRVPGLVTLEFAAVNGAQATEAAALPGDTTAEQKNKQGGRLSIDSGLSIRILDAENKQLTVDKDADVVAEVPARKDADAQIGVYSYDEEQGQWKEEGSAELRTNAESKSVYRADIDHLSWWSLGRFFDSVSCVRACVEDADGKPVSGAQIWVVGKSQSGVSSFYTDTTGCGAGDTIADLDVVMVAQSGQFVSASKTVSLGNVNASAGNNPSACQDAGRFVLGAASECALCADATDPVGGETVAGKVIDGSGVAVPGVEVLINNAAVTSDAQGRFEQKGVSIPYDLTLIEELSTDRRVTIYLNVERLDPVLRIGRGGQHSASGVGLITGGIGGALPPGHTHDVTFRAKGLISSFGSRRNPGDDEVWMTPGASVNWSGATTISGTLFAILFDSTDLSYIGIGSKSATFTSGQTLSSPASDIALAPVTTRSVNVSSTLPQGANLTYYALNIGTFSRSVSNPATAFSLEVPNNLPALFPAILTLNAVLGRRTISYAEDIAADATALNRTLLTPIEALEPSFASPRLSADRSFQFVPQANSLTTVSLTWDDYDPDEGSGAYHSTTVYTDGNEIDFDEIVALGADVSPGQTVSYSLVGRNEATDIDAFLDENRTSSGIRTLSYEAGFNLSLP